MAHDVFLSHSVQDKIIANAVCATLEERKIRCWIAPRDVSVGSDWPKAIVEAIEGCQIMVLVFSVAANTSKQVEKELTLATNRGKVILPLRVEEIAPSGTFAYHLENLHWLDAITPPLEHHLERLSEKVRFLLLQQATLETKDSERVLSEGVRSTATEGQSQSPFVRHDRTPSQREVMKQLISQFGLDKERVVQEYVAAEQRGEVIRRRNASRLSSEAYARALWADGIKKHWF